MLPRREFLRGLSALGVFSLAGCSDDGEGTDTLTETTRPGTTTVPFTVTETLHDPSTATTTQQTATRTTALTTTPVTETETSTDMVVAQSDPDTDSSQPTSTATQSTTSTTTTTPTDTMTDQVFWQDGDAASPENLSQLRAQTNSSDYVERGVTFTPDYANNELDISTGHAVIYDESTDRAYDVFPDARTNLALTDAATNYVYLMCDPENITGSGVDDDVGYHIDTDDTPPTSTETSSTTISVKVGEVDMTAAATSTEVNRDPAVSARSVDTEDGRISDAEVGTLKSHVVAGGDNGSLGMGMTVSRPNFIPEFVSEFTVTEFDHDIYHRSHFNDGKYRITSTHNSNSDTGLWSADDPADENTYTLLDGSIFDSGSDDYRVNDHIVLPNGRFAVYLTVNDTDPTEVWVGDSLTNLSRVGEVLSSHNDIGAIRAPDGVVHLYAEDPNDIDSTAQTSPIIVHFTTPVDDLTTATQQGTVIDVDARTWETGDPDLIRLFGRYLMFLDHKAGGDYYIAVAESDDLYNWEITTEKLTDHIGGDPTVAKFGGEMRLLTEQSGSDSSGPAAWRLKPHNYDGQFWARNRGIQWKFQNESLDGLSTGTSGTGTVSLDASNGYTRLETGTTSGSKANLIKWGNKRFEQAQWRANRTLVARVYFDSTGGQQYIVTGGADKGALNLAHVGFGMDNGNLVGSVGDGTSQTTTTLISGALSGAYYLRAEWDSFNKAEYVVNGTKEGEITSGLPAPASNQKDRYVMAFVGNSTATNRIMDIDTVRWAQAPESRLP